MKEIIINKNQIELRLENGINVRGEWYIKDKNVWLKSKTPYDLSILVKYEKEIKKKIIKK